MGAATRTPEPFLHASPETPPHSTRPRYLLPMTHTDSLTAGPLQTHMCLTGWLGHEATTLGSQVKASPVQTATTTCTMSHRDDVPHMLVLHDLRPQWEAGHGAWSSITRDVEALR